MTYNFNTEIMEIIDDTPLTMDNKPLTYAKAAIVALTYKFQDEGGLSQEKALDRYDLAIRIRKGGDIELSNTDKGEIKSCVHKFFNAAVLGRMVEFLG